MKNRKILPGIGTLVLALVFTNPLPALNQKVNLRPSSSTSQIYRIQTRLEGKGTVLPADNQALSLLLDARFQYDERVIARNSTLKAVRDYTTARAQIRLNQAPLVNELASGKSIIIAQTSSLDQPVKLASLGGPISQSEFELIDTPAATLILSRLFEKEAVRQGDSWKPGNALLARFLCVDWIDSSDVEIKLTAVQGTTATLFIGGDVDGTIDGASTSISVSGTAHFDVAKGIVSRCQITLSQQRDIGSLAPGLDAVFKIATRMDPISSSPNLTDEGLTSLRKKAGRISDRLLLTPGGSDVWLTHPRAWRVISNHSTRTIMRYAERGKMLGQCDIIPLPPRLTDQSQSLDQFKQVVKSRLSENSAEITGADQSGIGSDIEWLRVDATGVSAGVPLKWIYYTFTCGDGRRVQLVFTIEPGNERSFARAGQTLVESLRFKAANRNSIKGQTAGFSK